MLTVALIVVAMLGLLTLLLFLLGISEQEIDPILAALMCIGFIGTIISSIFIDYHCSHQILYKCEVTPLKLHLDTYTLIDIENHTKLNPLYPEIIYKINHATKGWYVQHVIKYKEGHIYSFSYEETSKLIKRKIQEI